MTFGGGVGSSIATPILASLADAYGRKAALISIAIGNVGGATAFACVPKSDSTMQIGLYLLCAFCGGLYSFLNTSFTAIADHTQDLPIEERAAIFSRVEAACWLGISMGPLLGGVIVEQIGFRITFAAAAGLQGLLLLFLLFVCPETLKVENRVPFSFKSFRPWQGLTLLASKRTPLLLSVACFVAGLGSGGAPGMVPLYGAKMWNWDSVSVGLWLTLYFGSSAVGLALLLPILLRRFSRRTILVMANCWAALIFAACAVVQEGYQFYLCAVFSTISGVYFPVARVAITSTFGASEYSKSLGGIALVQQFSALAAPTVTAQYWSVTQDYTPHGTFWFLASGCTLLAAGFCALAYSADEKVLDSPIMSPRMQHGGNNYGQAKKLMEHHAPLPEFLEPLNAPGTTDDENVHEDDHASKVVQVDPVQPLSDSSSSGVSKCVTLDSSPSGV